MRLGRAYQVLGRAAEADEEVMVVGIDGRTTSTEIRHHRDPVGLDPEAPRLGVVAVGGQRRIPDELPE